MDKAKSKPKIIIITGPESTGKTTIAQALAKHLNGIYIPELARNYIAGLNRKYTYSDILTIAEQQRDEFNKIVKSDKSPGIYIIDTYLILTKIWFLWNSGKFPDWIDNSINDSKLALYLLCNTELEWIPDSVRENGGEAREKLFNEYQKELEKNSFSYKIISGKNNSRIANAITFAKEYIER